MHFCHEELLALMSLIPGASYAVMRLRVWWHKRRECKCENRKEKTDE